MNRAIWIVITILFFIAQSLPAPIEPEQTPKPKPTATPSPETSPTASPEKSTTPKPKPSATAEASTANTEQTSSPTPPRVRRSTKAVAPTSAPITGGQRLVYWPKPEYPPAARIGLWPVKGSGEFRVTFGGDGSVTNVEVVRTTGHEILDAAAIDGLKKWKATPGAGWSTVVPVTLDPGFKNEH